MSIPVPFPAVHAHQHGTQDLNDMYYFACIVEAGSFSAAGRQLNLSKSHLSRRLSALEARLGLRLLERSTRKLRLTAAGERYLAYCQAIVDTVREADESMLGLLSEPTGEVRVSCPIGIAQIAFPSLLPEFMRSHPKVTVRLHVVSARVDLFRDPIDIALRARQNADEDEGIIVRRFGPSKLHIVASKHYVDHWGAPRLPEDLARHRTLTFDVFEQPPHIWELQDADGSFEQVVHHPALLCADMNILVEAVLAGQGIALLPAQMVENKRWSHDLVEVLPGWAPRQATLYAAYASRRGMTPAMRALLEFLSEKLSTPADA